MKKAAMVVLLASLSGAVFADDGPSATPSRPTVASGASISEPGWLEVEFGAQRTGAESHTRRDSLPYLLKYAVTPNWALWLGGEAHIRDRVGNITESGIGDTSFTVKHKLALADGPVSGGFELTVKAPTANDEKGLGSGKKDYTLRGIYGVDLPAGYHYDTNLAVTRLGANEAGTGRNSYLFANAVSRPFNDRVTLAADFSVSAQDGTKPVSLLMLAGSYAYSKRVVFDTGAQFGVSNNAPNWTVFAGVTMLVGKLGN